MPGPGATDPTDLRAHARAHLSLSRQLKQMHHETPHMLDEYDGDGNGCGSRRICLLCLCPHCTIAAYDNDAMASALHHVFDDGRGEDAIIIQE
jgi:hypothetical protein